MSRYDEDAKPGLADGSAAAAAEQSKRVSAELDRRYADAVERARMDYRLRPAIEMTETGALAIAVNDSGSRVVAPSHVKTPAEARVWWASFEGVHPLFQVVDWPVILAAGGTYRIAKASPVPGWGEREGPLP